MGNFNSLMAIIAGMNMTWVSRLKKTVRDETILSFDMFTRNYCDYNFSEVEEVIMTWSLFPVVTGKYCQV